MSASSSEDRDESAPAPVSAEDLADRLQGFRPRLERMLKVRMDPRLRRRIDPADVLQESFLDVVRRLPDYRARSSLPFFLWVRLLTGQKLAEFHRRHLEAEQRAAGREVTPGSIPAASSASLAELFVDPERTPSRRAERLELQGRVRSALDELEALDRELLTLRYFEGLSNEEAALVLELSPSSAQRRHIGALQRLRAVLPRGDDAWSS